MLKNRYFFIIFSLFFWLTQVQAITYQLPNSDNEIVGSIQTTEVKSGDSFTTIAQKYDIGYYQIVEANPGVDPDNPPIGTVLIVPTKYILPNIRQGIVINLAEMRLYYFPPDKSEVFTVPIGIGRRNWNTPTGDLKIVQKIKNPVWIVPKSIYKYRQEQGDPVPKVIQSGPQNPLGFFAMRLSDPTYLIHGTDDPAGVGRRSSAGCIRLYGKDIKALFAQVEVGTPVHIINTPYKAGWTIKKLYLESHIPLSEQREKLAGDLSPAVNSIADANKNNLASVDWQAALKIAKQHLGFPRAVGDVS